MQEQPVTHCAVLHATKVTIRILSSSSFNFARGNVVCYVIWDCFIDNWQVTQKLRSKTRQNIEG